MSDVSEFLRLFLNTSPDSPKSQLDLDYLTVVSVDTVNRTVALELPGATGPLPGVRYLKGASLAAGDLAVVFKNGPDWWVMGAFA